MIKTEGRLVKMTAGDFGAPIPIRVTACCCCADDLLPSDELVVAITQEDRILATRTKTWGEIQEDEGSFSIELTEAESKAMPAGLYAWRIWLARSGDLHNTVADGLLFVGVTA